MSFVWKAAARLKSPEQCAAETLEVAKARGLDDFAAVLGVMAMAGESDFWCPWNENDPSSKNYDWDSQSDDGRSVAYLQQQNGREGDTLPDGDSDNWWGPMASRMDLKRSMNEFLDRLPSDYGTANGNPAASSEMISRVQNPRPDLRQAYAQHYDKAWALVHGVPAPTEGDIVPGVIQGDPMWLEDVLRPVLGDKLKTLDGWKTDGVGGTMGVIWGVVWHHTGNAAEDADSISKGRPDLQGPLAQIHIGPDGTVTVVAVGPCNHAGVGSWVGIPTDGANQVTIGIECAYPKDTTLTEATIWKEDWPDAQMDSMLIVGAAITQYLGNGVSHNISHKEWAQLGPAGFRQGKWDPGHLDMDWFREKMEETRVRLFEDTPVDPPVPPAPVAVPDVAGGAADDQLTYRFNCLGGQTLVEAVAEIRDAVLGTNDRGNTGVKMVVKE